MQALRRASKLEMLDMWVRQPTAQDVDLLTTLPALRKLIVETRQASDPVAVATLTVCRRASHKLRSRYMLLHTSLGSFLSFTAPSLGP